MKSNLLDRLLTNYVNDFGNQKYKNIVFVVPSKRAAYYSKHKLQQLYKENKINHIIPNFITPSELIEGITNLIVPSKVDLIHYLYLSYKKVFQKESEPYASFVKWAPMLLNDFNDVILTYPNDAEKQKQIFTNLKDIKEIEHWSLSREPLSDNQARYLELMKKFYTIFEDFNKTLLEKNYAYSGLAYAEAVKSLNNNPYIEQVDMFHFVGLNAINPAEKIIYEYLKNKNKALFYWDYDIYYVNNEFHEAGYFIRENIKKFGDSLKLSNDYFNVNKDVTIASATNDVEEALFIKNQLNELLKTNKELNNVAILLHKPESLNLILSAIPEDVEYNVTMEYPLYLTSAYQFLMQLLKIFIQHTNETNKERIYYKLFINLILNPFFKNYAYHQLNIKESIIHKIVNNIKQKNIIYIPINDTYYINEAIYSEPDELKEKIRDNYQSFLNIFKQNTLSGIIKSILHLFDSYLNTLLCKNIKDVLTINILYSICEQLNRIEDILERNEGDVFQSIRDVYVLVQQILSRESVAFKGEPLRGLQVLGLLESRLLDFDTIFIPFMNEGIFPPNRFNISFLPYDLRKYYNLPTYYNEDAIFSYLFYRNLHQPKCIYLSYNNAGSSDETGIRAVTGEPSRFIQQINYEFSQKKNNIKINNFSITPAGKSIQTPDKIEVAKDKSVIEKLYSITYSPTSITTYLDCSLKFYFRYLLGLKTTDDAVEQIRADLEGNIFHTVMRIIFSEYRGKNIQVDAIRARYLDDMNAIRKIIDEEIQRLNLDKKGKVLIQSEILADDIRKFLDKLLKETHNNIEVIYVENEQNSNDDFVCLNRIRIYGRPDRIDFDSTTNSYRIIDYKSSFNEQYDEMSYETINQRLFETKNKKNVNKQLQLLMYIYYAIKNKLIKFNERGNGVTVVGAILPLRIKTNSKNDNNKNNNSLHKFITINKGLSENTKEILAISAGDFKHKIETLLERIFNEIICNEKLTFKQTENTIICRYCDFNTICKIK